jgi:mono/diheme cytochrome c family protein
MRRASALAALVLAFALSAAAQDPGRGRELYDTHCLGCHYERIHKRDPSRSLIRTPAQLRVEVAKWAEQTGRPFTLEDLDDIAAYLDRSHYRLQEPR